MLKEKGANITANSLHPGVINSNLLRYHSFLDCKLTPSFFLAFTVDSFEPPFIFPLFVIGILRIDLGKYYLCDDY